MHRDGDSGFTLIELMISLGLFALIAVAGLSLVDSVLGVQGRTEARLDRLADLQRAMMVVSGDLDQIATGDIAGDGDRLSFTRAAPGFGGPSVPVTYGVSGGVLTRSLAGAPQAVLGGIAGARWRYYDDAWQSRWPAAPDAGARWPRAIELELNVAGAGSRGVLRRVVLLPARAREAPAP